MIYHMNDLIPKRNPNNMTIYNEIIQCDVYVKVAEEEVSKKQDKNTFKTCQNN